MPLLLSLCLISALLTLVVAVQFVTALRRISWSSPSPSSGWDGLNPKVKLSVIIPARNEEEDIAQALQSVLDQTGVDLEAFAVNDHSTDRTGSIVDSLASSDPRLKAIHNPELPPGWLGKCNAMQQAAALATGAYLVFTDADVIHEPSCFATAVAELERSRLDFLSFFPKMHFVDFWENVLVPALVGAIAQYATPGIEDGSSPDAFAAGAFMIVRSEAFRAVDGFEPIRREIFDDVSLARLLKQGGYRVGFRASPDLLRVRLFKGNHHAFWGMTKNVLEVLGGRFWLAPLVVMLPFFVFWTPLAAVVVGLAQGDRLLVSVALATLAAQYGMLWLGRRVFDFHPLKALGFPLVAVVIAICMLRASYYYLVQGSVRWRGRTVRLDS